jgi:hypothetical protein
MTRTLLAAVLGGISAVLVSADSAFAGLSIIPVRVPEPTSLALIAAGVGAVAWVKFRRGK